jgi:putative glutamine amidotransferase
MSRPLIVVTTSVSANINEYLEAIEEAGGEPVRLDPTGDGVAALERADGLLLTGGVDVDPARYGGSPSPLIDGVDAARDDFEIPMVIAARERGMPTLAICRGLQVANVALGGTLIADIPTALGDRSAIPHERKRDGKNERGVFAEHVVTIERESRLAQIVGTTQLATGARHHQAVDRCADDLRVVGRTPDAIIEALEPRFASPFWLAVQWHPESTRALDAGESRAIFRAFADAARLVRR